MPKPLKLRIAGEPASQPTPPPALAPAASRAGDGSAAAEPLLDGIRVTAEYTLAPASRDGSAAAAPAATVAQQLLALEAEDGTTVFIRADSLAEHVQRMHPEAVVDGAVDLTRLRDPQAASRGLGEWLWRKVRVLELPDDLGAALEDGAYAAGSYLGTKALMQAIESRLAGEEGLYAWTTRDRLGPADLRRAGDSRLLEAAKLGPMLVLIHGTASSTLGSYAGLAQHGPTWDALNRQYPGGIYGFEHRTFSKSPAQNALELLKILPDGAAVSLLTHSRGGLVGDLLCLGDVRREVIDDYGRAQPPSLRGIADAALQQLAGLKLAELGAAAEDERQLLLALQAFKREQRKNLRLERYLRVACPARGTRLLSDNLDVFLSALLTLLQKGGAALASALATPPVGQAASSLLGVVKRLVLEIADRRLDPRLVPGIAAMGVESPLAAFLADPRTVRNVGTMAVVAGDTEFEGLGFDHMLRRVTNLFADWALFDRYDNDLVVDTDSMYAGLGQHDGTRYLYDRNGSVDHFNYFRNALTRDAACRWLAASPGTEVTPFQLLAGDPVPWRDRAPPRTRGGAAARPVVIFLPGVMGSHLEAGRPAGGAPGSGSRVWLDLLALRRGDLRLLADPDAGDIGADDLFETFYGDLADHLGASHTVQRLPYDWRRPLEHGAGLLKEAIERALAAHKGQPVRLLAHSMGGLVARMLIARHPKTWQQLVDSDGRLVMLGTPNRGSHLLAHALLGKSATVRQLALLDGMHTLQQIVDFVGGFPGTLSLLPAPGFDDGGSAQDFYEPATWARLKAANRDRWFADHIGWQPAPGAKLLANARDTWGRLQAQLDAGGLDPERVSYVFGQGRETPCGVRIVQAGGEERLELLFTPQGDGSVTWKSGGIDSLLAANRCWYMPVEHADLAGSEEHFPAIVDLLETGQTVKLDRLPRSRGSELVTSVREAPPPVQPSAGELARSLLGSGPRRRTGSRDTLPLEVAVRAGDLRFVHQPVLCGHYLGDALAGAERALDDMLDGRLAERDRLGLYAGELGSSAIVLMPRSEEEVHLGSRRGAVIVGLGEMQGMLTPRQISETVRAAVLRLLMLERDALGQGRSPLNLTSLLLGCNSNPNLSVAESVAAVTLGVAEANRQFADGMADTERAQLAVSRLEFIELYLDAAITAANTLRELPQRLAADLRRTRTRLLPDRQLLRGQGLRPRLYMDGVSDYWPRLMITGAGTPLQHAPGEARAPAAATSAAAAAAAAFPPPTLPGSAAPAAPPSPKPPARPTQPRLPPSLRYVFMSQRARAESIEQPRQPDLVESLLREQLRNTRYSETLGRILFFLTVPLAFKAAAREQKNLVLVVDKHSANLPWEMLQPEDRPLVLDTALVRQLATSQFRRGVRTAVRNTACIVVDPSTQGYGRQFGQDGVDLVALPSAVREGEAVQRLLEARWDDAQVTYVPSGTAALDVLGRLTERPYRLLMIAAHGVFEARAADDSLRSGVVLSDGILLTALEIGQMEVVPEIVFLNCCHLGRIEPGRQEGQVPDKLAYSLASELIEMGVRCVVVAGWAVDDAAAATFAETFFESMVADCLPFGAAILAARRRTWEQHRETNTWGAYQAYGDPDFRLCERRGAPAAAAAAPVSIDELLDTIQSQRLRAARRGAPDLAWLRKWVDARLADCPQEWAGEPAVQQALAGLYAALGDEGFEAARGHYLRAINGEDGLGLVAITSIEQLANLEALTGERRGRAAGGKGARQVRDAGLVLINSAIERMNALARVCAGGSDELAGLAPNGERWAILGSAYKRRATLELDAGAAWEGAVLDTLRASRDAYGRQTSAAAAARPYQLINRLQLDWLLASADEAAAARVASIKLALKAGDDARQAYAHGKRFFDAVGGADAALTAWLWGAQPDATPQDLLAPYAELLSALPWARRQSESVVKQIRWLARCLQARAAQGDARQSAVLAELAEHIDAQSGRAAAGGGKKKPGTRSSA